MSDGPTKTKRRTRTPAERISDLLVTYLGRKQISTFDVEDADVVAGVRAAVEYTKA